MPVPWYDNPEPNPAGSLSASALDLSHWLTFQLGDGRYRGKRLLSAEALAETHTPQQVIPVGPVADLHFKEPGNIFSAKPELKPTIDDGPIAEPKVVALPKGQTGQ